MKKKFRTVRSTVWTLVAASVLIPVFAVFVGLTGSLQPDDTILGGSLTGATVAQIIAAAFGVLLITSEYGNKLVHTTFAASPRRSRVLAAKAVVISAVLFLTTFVFSLSAYGIGTVLLPSDDYATGQPFPALLGIALCFLSNWCSRLSHWCVPPELRRRDHCGPWFHTPAGPSGPAVW